jgi:very-short-patch-repair endonuclease
VWRKTADSERFLATPADLALQEVAARQGGVVSLAQLRAAGMTEGTIRYRVRAGRLLRLHRGVYAVGHSQLTPLGWRWAAVLACGGPGLAALSHRSAAAVWDLLPSPAQFDVSTLANARSTAKIRAHRGLQPLDITTVDGLPVTTLARTLVDLTTTLTPHQTERVVHRAEHLRLLDTRSLDEQLARAHGRPTRKLRAAVATLAAAEPDITRTVLEERFLALVLDAQLPRPEVNAMVGDEEVDFLWRTEKLIVETDGAATHLTAEAFEEDRRRDAVHSVMGFRTLRFTWRQVVYEPRFVAAAIAAAMAG